MNATMKLSKVRQGWSEIETLETQILRRLTVEAGIRQYLALQAEFEPQLQASEPYFRQQRNEALAQLQARLLTLNQRIGDHRVLYEILVDERTIVIHAIGHRRDIYKRR